MDPETMSYLHTPMHMRYRYQTIPDRLKVLADELGDKEVFVFLGRDDKRESITARELFNKSTQLARSLVKFGVAKGDIVGLCLDNDLTCLLCYFGVILAGGVVFSFEVTQKDASDVERKLKELDVSTFILHSNETHDQFLSCLNFIDDVSPDGAVTSKSLPSLRRFVSTSNHPDYHPMLLDELFIFATDDDKNVELPRLDPEDTTIMYATSGSTGWPKFIPVTHHSILIYGSQDYDALSFEPGDIMYSERKLIWIGGFPLGYVHNGMKTVNKSVTFSSLEDHCRFTLRAIRSEKCTLAELLVATIVEALHNPEVKTNPFPLLKNISSCGLPCTSATIGAVGLLTDTLMNAYGSTECGGISYEIISAGDEFIPFCTGKPMVGVEIKVVGTDGHVVARGVTGNVHVRSPTVLYQYYNNPAMSKEVISSTHWFNTNDIGYVTNDGRLVVMGRAVEQIIQGGSIVHPAMVESIVKTHPDVREVVVVPIPDEYLFQQVCACVVLKPGCTLTIDDVNKLYKSREYSERRDPFASQHPKAVVVFDSFPMLPSDKPDKAKITERAIQKLKVKQRW